MTLSVHETQTLDEFDMPSIVAEAIRLATCGRCRDIAIEISATKVVVSGRVPTFHLQQRILAACRKAIGLQATERLSVNLRVDLPK
jgi:hypothetical protein